MPEIIMKHSSTVEFIKNLKIANFTEPQIEILAKRDEEYNQQLEQISEITNQTKSFVNSKELATKGDIRESELRLQKEIEILRSTLTKDIKNLEIKLLSIYGGGFLILVGILARGFHWL